MDQHDQAIQIAVEFLRQRNIRYEEPISVKPLARSRMEVTLMAEGFSNPALVIDPPNIIVQINLETRDAVLVDQM